MHERVLEKLKYKKVLNNTNQKSAARQNRLALKLEQQNSVVGTSSTRLENGKVSEFFLQ